MGEFSITHLLLLAGLALLFFGPSRLPQLGQSLGRAIRGFKQGINEINAEAKPIQDDPASEQLSSGQKASKSETQNQKDKNHV